MPAHAPVAAARRTARAAVHGGSDEPSQLGARRRVAIRTGVARPDVVIRALVLVEALLLRVRVRGLGLGLVGARVLVEALLFEEPLLIGGVAARLVPVGGVAHRRLAANVPEECVPEGTWVRVRVRARIGFGLGLGSGSGSGQG